MAGEPAHQAVARSPAISSASYRARGRDRPVRAAPGRRVRGNPVAAIQAHGGNGLASGYGLFPLRGTARLLRIAPVSREMILNYVARHSLGLPRSY